jgi:hypothetical protein
MSSFVMVIPFPSRMIDLEGRDEMTRFSKFLEHNNKSLRLVLARF